MCDEAMQQVDGVAAGAAPMEAQIVSLWEVVEGLRQELIELRMDRRKVMLEELARLEEPLVEQGVIARRTRPPRHGPGD